MAGKKRFGKTIGRKSKNIQEIFFLTEYLGFISRFTMCSMRKTSRKTSKNYALGFFDFSQKVPFNSENADYIKRGLRDRISQSSVTIVLVTDVTHRSNWVNWEIRESIRQNKNCFLESPRNK